MNRSCGVLMHISSLPSSFGVGTLGQEAFDFVDFMSEAGLKLWQVLPVCPVDEFGSPYCSSSTFAGNPLFIDLPLLQKQGLIDSVDFENLNWGNDDSFIDFCSVQSCKRKVLKVVFEKWLKINGPQELESFAEANFWAKDYAVFQVLFESFSRKVWWKWPEEFKFRNRSALEVFFNKHIHEIFYFLFEQLLFFKQWSEVKRYANGKGVGLIGDLPIYVSGNSADVWANPKNFCLGENLEPKKVAGCPPDAFSADGQLWGNPVYDWNEMRKNGYDWWVKRFKNSCLMFDWVRVDHFRGFESFYAIQAGQKTAREGCWIKGPGLDFFRKVEQKLGKLNLIAEDLGFLTYETKKLLEQTGFCGMKVLQFAFDPREKSIYLPHTYTQNSVCYTGTHDNNTIVGWFNEIDEQSRDYCKRYLNFESEPVNWALIRAAVASVCKFAIIPIQDFLGLDGTCRMNVPGTVKNNWKWRLTKKQVLSSELALKIRNLLELYGR